MSNLSGFFDNQAVAQYDAKFAGSFDLAEELGSKMKIDDVVVFLVTATIGQSQVTTTKSGDLKRTNRLDVIAIRDIDAQAAAVIENTLNNPQGKMV